MDQTRCDSAYRTLCDHAPAMWRRDENDAPDIGARLEDQCLFEERLRFGRNGGLRRRCAEEIAPNFVTARVGDHQPAKNATHAMTYQNNRAVIWKRFVQRIELAPKQQG